MVLFVVVCYNYGKYCNKVGLVMEFNIQLEQFANRLKEIKDSITTEEATKMSMIVPFFKMLGYDVFNSAEFCPEYTADVGIKKGEKVDYAILQNGEPVILVECKWCGELMDKHSSQLFRYFGTTTAKFGILTNGIIYKFFTDLEEANKMDMTPFLEIDLLNMKEPYIGELKKFCKDCFDGENIASTASELKYSKMIREFLQNEINEPSDDFVRLVLSEIYDGQKTQKVIERFKNTVKRAFSNLVNDMVNQKITAALNANEEQNQTDSTDSEINTTNKISTTDDEIQGYYIIRGLLAEVTNLNDIYYRDTESYFGILYKDNNRKPICRLSLDRSKKYIFIPDSNKDFNKYQIKTLDDIYKYKEELVAAVKNYM